MTIYWDDTKINEAHRTLVEKAIRTGIEYVSNECVREDYELSVIFASSEEIRRINNNYRGIDDETDVLSFPGFPGSPALGDIVICMEVAERQAREYGHTPERELAFLAVHGLLHLMGYDHDTPEEEKRMCAAQEEILRMIGAQR
ncbi:MAG: rRNA maturation RNase YbeY [Defluviitaleaceae bacterium]|nr:rRNA maturation RNase YbeY [Defluviitaleaceae bacterium]